MSSAMFDADRHSQCVLRNSLLSSPTLSKRQTESGTAIVLEKRSTNIEETETGLNNSFLNTNNKSTSVTSLNESMLPSQKSNSKSSLEEKVYRSPTKIGLRDSNNDKSRMYANFADIRRQLDNLSDDEFYIKLQQLKEEHRQTLEFCEYLYNSKYKRDSSEMLISPVKFHAINYSPIRNVDTQNSFSDGENVDENLYYHRPNKFNDRVLDMSTRPPTGHHTYGESLSHIRADLMLRERPSSAPTQRTHHNGEAVHAMYRASDDQNFHDHGTDELSDGSIEEIESERKKNSVCAKSRKLFDNEEYISSMDKIESMWDSFSIDRYAPRSTLYRSISSETLKTRPRDTWRHRITVPVEFDMMQRESNKEKKKSRSMVMHEKEIEEQQATDAVQLQKKFKARPVPAHVYVPMYDEIRARNEARREHVKENSKKLLKSLEQPFSFDRRVDNHNMYQTRTQPYKVLVSKYGKKPAFKAKAVPSHVLDNHVSQRLLEEEEYKKIRNKMRQEKMLNDSSMPPRMHLHYQTQKQKKHDTVQKVRRENKNNHHAPRKTRKVPDYNEIYQKFQKTIYKNRKDPQCTVVKPFNLSYQRANKNNCRTNTTEDVNFNYRETISPTPSHYSYYRNGQRYSSLGHSHGVLTSSLDSIPHASTEAYRHRTSTNRQKIDHVRQSEEDFVKEKQQRMKDMKVRDGVKRRAALLADEYKPTKTVAERLREHKHEDAERISEYRRGLQEMNKRVAERPFLFEKTHQDSVKKSAERNFARTLSRHSIDEDMLESRASKLSHYSSPHYSHSFEDEDLDISPS